MPKFMQRVERLFLPIIALIAFVCSVISYFPPFSNFLPQSSIASTVLLLVALILGSIAFIQSKITELQQELYRVSSDTEIEHMQTSLKQMNPILRKIFEDRLMQLIVRFKEAVKDGKVTVDSGDQYRHYYISTLQAFPGATFYAAGFLKVSYLWNDPDVESAIEDFIQKSGGKLMRIFFVRDSDDLNAPEIQEVLDRQCKIGVEVYWLHSNSVFNDLKKNFLVEANGVIAWETFMYEDLQLGNCIATTNQQETQRYCNIFARLRAGKLQRYIPQSRISLL